MPAVPPPDSALATRDDIRRLEQLITALQTAMDRIVRDQEVHFKRMAQLQADIDLVRGAWTKMAAAEQASAAKRGTYTGAERRITARKK